MTSIDETLLRLSALVAFGCPTIVIVGYFIGRRDLFLPSNFYLGGTALFIGVSGMRAASTPHMVTYPSSVYYKLFVGFAVFFAAILLTYLLWRFPRRMAGRFLRKWPLINTATMLILSIITIALAMIPLFPTQIPVVTQLIGKIFIHLGPFAFVFALAAWHLDRSNPLCIVNVLVVGGLAILLSVSFGTGRRQFVGILMAAIIYGYWVWLRYKPRLVALWLLGFAVVGAWLLLQGFGQVRHRAGNQGGMERAVESLQLLARGLGSAAQSNLYSVSQPSVEMALLTIHTFTGIDRSRDGSPFFVVYNILANPIPRVLWPLRKPESLGKTVPEIGKQRYGFYGYGSVKWSINPVAYGYHDGGLFPIFVYGAIIGGLLRFFDELMIRQSTNPFLIGLLAASSGHITGFPRGSMDVMTWMLIGCVFAFLMLKFLSGLLFGPGTEYPRTDHVVNYPRFGRVSNYIRRVKSGRESSPM